MSQFEIEKENAAKKAVEFVEDDMLVGLGSGSTAAYAVKELGRKVSEGLRIIGIPSSEKTAALAREVGIELTKLGQRKMDINIDGADEFDPYLQLIKGGGGALLREKILAVNSLENIIIVDSRKQVNRLGAFKLPIEVIPFSYEGVNTVLVEMQLSPQLRQREGNPYITDEGNYIIDLDISKARSMKGLDLNLQVIPGVIETGLFLGLASKVIMGIGNEIKLFE